MSLLKSTYFIFLSQFLLCSCMSQKAYKPLDIKDIIERNKERLFTVYDTEECLEGNSLKCHEGLLNSLKESEINKALINKFNLYEKNIEKNFLESGMVVGRELHGEKRIPADLCDSLLFSSLRYYALNRLYFNNMAYEAWRGILSAYVNGQWYRHPDCLDTPISRDMFLGIMLLTNEDHPDSDKLLDNLTEIIDLNNGFFSFKHRLVSYLSPGLAKTYGKVLKNRNLKNSFVADKGFSTYFIEKPFLERDYRTHLLALHIFIEISLYEKFQEPIESWVEDASNKIYELDKDNQFYKFLKFKTMYLKGLIDYDNFKSRLEEIKYFLLKSRYFPSDTSPSYCTRGSDYLWQRTSDEWPKIRTELEKLDSHKVHIDDDKTLLTKDGLYCSDIYWHGVDYMFLLSLVLETNLYSKK